MACRALPRPLTGIVFQANALIRIFNVSAGADVDRNLELVSESGSSTATNRFAIRDNANVLPGEAVTIWGDPTSARWRISDLGRT